MGSPFRSFTVPIVKPPTPAEMAADLAIEMIERYKELRADAMRREAECEPPAEWTPEAQECIDTLEALIGPDTKPGPHRAVVLPIILEHFPELVGMGKLVEQSRFRKVDA